MNKTISEFGSLTLLEAARLDPPLHKLQYSDQCVAEIANKFRIPESKRAALHECLEGAAEAYKRSWQDPKDVVDIEAARLWMTRLCNTLEDLIELSAPIEMFNSGGIAIGNSKRFEGAKIRNALSFADGLLHLTRPLRQNPQDGRLSVSGKSLVELAEWRRRHVGDIYLQIEVLRAAASAASGKVHRKDKLLPLKIWTLCLGHFWQKSLNRKVTILREVVSDEKRGGVRTVNNSKFAQFCGDCFKLSDDEQSPDLRTPIEVVKRHLDREREAIAAVKARDAVRYQAIMSEWTDRIPVALPFDFVRST